MLLDDISPASETPQPRMGAFGALLQRAFRKSSQRPENTEHRRTALLRAHLIYAQHFTHSLRALFSKSENQLLCFHARAHDFVEMGGVPKTKAKQRASRSLGPSISPQLREKKVRQCEKMQLSALVVGALVMGSPFNSSGGGRT
jgi:hypothetical protein